MTKRDIKGKFTLKNEEHRIVRSLRLTDSTWEKLGVAAQSSDMTRADWLEDLVTKNEQSTPCMTWKKEGIVLSDEAELVTKNEQSTPCMTWEKEGIVLSDEAELVTKNEQSTPCMTWEKEEIEANDKVEDKVEENTQPSKQVAFRMEDLEAFCAQVLKNLRLGKQASGYKAALFETLRYKKSSNNCS